MSCANFSLYCKLVTRKTQAVGLTVLDVVLEWEVEGPVESLGMSEYSSSASATYPFLCIFSFVLGGVWIRAVRRAF